MSVLASEMRPSITENDDDYLAMHLNIKYSPHPSFVRE
jgi:hypothetical protein